MAKISKDEFEKLADFILKATGVRLEPGKEYLVESRLAPLLEESGASDFTEFLEKLLRGAAFELEEKVIDAITTQETSFFRDKGPFDLLKFKLLPDLLDARLAAGPPGGIPEIRIWSAASSTGQEPYSIAMAAMEVLGGGDTARVSILGTDISKSALLKAEEGVYEDFEVRRGLPPDLLKRWFTKVDGKWKVNAEIRSMVDFRQVDLRKAFRGLGKFDIIFCRNVVIYFDPEERKKLVCGLRSAMAPDGALILGAQEQLSSICELFVVRKHLNSVFYTLKETEDQEGREIAAFARRSPISGRIH